MKKTLTLAEAALGRRYPNVVRMLPPTASLDDACIEVEARTGANTLDVRDAALQTLKGHLRKETDGVKSIGRLCYRDKKAALWCLAYVARENFRLIAPDEACRRGVLVIERYVGGYADLGDVRRALAAVIASMEDMAYGTARYDQCYGVQQMLSVVVANGSGELSCLELQHAARSLATARAKAKERNHTKAMREVTAERIKIAREVAEGILTLPMYDRIRA